MKSLAVKKAWPCVCVVSMATLSVAQVTPNSATPSATAVVNVRVDTAYDDSNRSLTLLRTIAQYAPVRSVIVTKGDTLDSVFVREYGFGESDLPKSYGLLLPIILVKNHLNRPEDLKPGTLVIPAIPKRAWMRWSRHNLMNYFSNMSIFPTSSVGIASASANRNRSGKASSIEEQSPSELAYNQSIPIDDHRFTAPTEVLQFGMPIGVARKLLEDTSFEKGTVTAFTYPLPVKLASGDACDKEDASRDHKTLSETQKKTLTAILQRSTRSPVVFILDTGWPSYDAYLQSRAALYDVLNAVWEQKFGIKFSSDLAQHTIPKALNAHCRCIDRALRELQGLFQQNAAGQVRLIYLPLTQEQGAKTILADLLQTSELLARSQTDKVALNSQIIRAARAHANTLVKRFFPTQWVGDEIKTDKSLLDAVLLIGQAYASVVNSVFFVSESWTVTHEQYGGKYYVDYQTPQYGIVVSAAGNDGTTTLLDFAQRSRSARDTIAIMNMTATGLARDSTRISASDIDTAEAAGFDGAVTDDVSGTSFSAPRIAWFLAAGEAVRTKGLNLDHWGVDLQSQLQALRDSKAIGYQKLLFDPLRYIDSQSAATDKHPSTN